MSTLTTVTVTVPFVRDTNKDERPWNIMREIIPESEIARDRPACYGDKKVNCRAWCVDKKGVTWYDAKSYRDRRNDLQCKYLAALTPDEIWTRLERITPLSLKKATAAIVWWDLIGCLDGPQVEEMKKKYDHFEAFCKFATYYDKIGAMRQWVGKRMLAEALMTFGWFRECADERCNERNAEVVEMRREYGQLAQYINNARDVVLKAEQKAAKLIEQAQEKAKRIEERAQKRLDALPKAINRKYNGTGIKIKNVEAE